RATYHRDDLARALERAVRYRAYSWSAVERILAAQARPRSVGESLEAEAQEQLDEIFRQSPLSVRSTAEYQSLLEETAHGDEDEDDQDKRSCTLLDRQTLLQNSNGRQISCLGRPEECSRNRNVLTISFLFQYFIS